MLNVCCASVGLEVVKRPTSTSENIQPFGKMTIRATTARIIPEIILN